MTTKLKRIGSPTNAPERWSVRSRMWESRLSGSERALGGGEMSRTSKPTPRATRPANLTSSPTAYHLNRYHLNPSHLSSRHHVHERKVARRLGSARFRRGSFGAFPRPGLRRRAIGQIEDDRDRPACGGGDMTLPKDANERIA
jgi:hypothetical protein